MVIGWYTDGQTSLSRPSAAGQGADLAAAGGPEARLGFQAGRIKIQAGRNKIQARRNEIQIRRNKIQMPIPSTNAGLSMGYPSIPADWSRCNHLEGAMARVQPPARLSEKLKHGFGHLARQCRFLRERETWSPSGPRDPTWRKKPFDYVLTTGPPPMPEREANVTASSSRPPIYAAR